MFRTSPLYLCLLLTFVPSPPWRAFAADAGTTTTATPALDSEEWAFLTLINDFRAQNGVSQLQVSVALENSAKWMSTDMATKNYISHTDSLGRSPGARLAAFGYTYSGWGENLAAGLPDAQTAFNAFATACDPDGSGACTYAHRSNMLGAGYRAIGIARAAGGSYGWYWTTDFGSYLEQSIPPNSSGPTISSFTATPSSVTAGQPTLLAWSVSGAGSVTVDNGVGDVSTVTSKSVSPSQTTTYTLTASNNAGSSLSRVTVTVTPLNTPAPGIPVACAAVPTGAFIGCYYSNTTLTGTPSFVRTDPQINFDWSGNVPDRSIGRGSFSVRWQGNFVFNQGTYTFSSLSSDGMRLYVDGALILDAWHDQAAALNSGQQTLSQGVHLITVEYYEQTGWSVAHLTWQSSAPVVQVPAILSFSAVPSTVTAGQPVTLTWSVSGPATLGIDNGVGDVSGTLSKSVVPGQTVTYTLTATNSAGSSTARVTVTVNSTADTQPPSTPTLISAVAASSIEVDLMWTPSVDNVSVAGYRILRNGLAVASVQGLSWADTSASPGTSYTYSIQAYDAAGNYSAPSNSSQVTTPAAPVSSGTCPTTPVGAFTGCYYANITLSGSPAVVRTDPQINFDWGGNPPDRSVGRSGFSARWQGSFEFAQGSYTFTAMTSDGIRLYIDGVLTLDSWIDQAATRHTVQQTLSQGLHVIAVEYYERTGWSTAHLTWQKN